MKIEIEGKDLTPTKELQPFWPISFIFLPLIFSWAASFLNPTMLLNDRVLAFFVKMFPKVRFELESLTQVFAEATAEKYLANFSMTILLNFVSTLVFFVFLITHNRNTVGENLITGKFDQNRLVTNITILFLAMTLSILTLVYLPIWVSGSGRIDVHRELSLKYAGNEALLMITRLAITFISLSVLRLRNLRSLPKQGVL
jgi:hypothetical protein